MKTARGETDSATLRRARAVLRIVSPLAILTVLWNVFDGEAALARLATASPAWLVAAVLAANLQIVLSALRWRLTAGRLGLEIGVSRAVGDYYLAQLLNQTLPGGVLGDVARAVRTRHEADLVRAGQAVVIERMAGQIALFAVMACGLATAILLPGGLELPAPNIPSRVSILIGIVAVAIAGFALVRLQRFLAGFVAAIEASLLAPGVWRTQAALGLAVVACNLATFAFAARATGTVLSAEAVFVLVPLILTAMLLPLSIGGWGFREGAAAFLFPLAGATQEAGLAASVAFGVVILVSALPGMVTLALPSRGARTVDGAAPPAT